MRAAIRPRALTALALLAALALALGACGGSDDSTGAGSAAAAGPDTEQMAEFESCMEENGATLPEPGAGEQAPQMQAPDEDTQAALEACSELMPAPPGGAPVGSPVAPPDS